MVIAIVDTLHQPDLCSRVVRTLLPRAACLITPAVRDIWKSDDPVPPLSGVLVHGAPANLSLEDQDTLSEMARRFPLAYTSWEEAHVAEWASRCGAFQPQRARQPDRLSWACDVTVRVPREDDPRTCSTANVSLGGIYVRDPLPPPEVGDLLAVTFPSLDARIKGTAVVRWVQKEAAPARPVGYGCQFVEDDGWVGGVLVNAARNAKIPSD